MPLGHQIIIRLSDDRPIAPDPVLARRFIASVGRIVGDLPVPGIGLGGGHGHIEALVDRATAGELARRLEIGTGQVLRHGVPWERARIRPVHDQRHAQNLFWYILDQPRHHDLEPDPLFESSNLPDLLGARITLAATRGVVRRLLPSVRRARLLEVAGLPPEPDSIPLVPELLGQAAAAAVCVPRLAGHAELVRAARVAAAHVARPHLRPGQVAELLGLTPRAERGLRQQEPRADLLQAVTLQWQWRSHVRALEAASRCAA